MKYRYKTIRVAALALFAGVIAFFMLTQNSSLFKAKSSFAKDTAAINNLLAEGRTLLAGGGASKKNEVMAIALKVKERSEAIGFPEGVGESYVLQGEALIAAQDKIYAREQLKKAIVLFSKNRLTENLATAYGWFAFTFSIRPNEIRRRIAYYETAAKYYGLCGKKTEQGSVLQHVADFCILNNDLLKAKRVLHNAVEIFESIDFKTQHGAYSLLNEVYTMLGDYRMAIQCGHRAIVFARESNDTTSQVCTIYNRLGIPQLHLHQYDSAILSFTKALAIAKGVQDYAAMDYVVKNLSNAYIKAGRFEDCITMTKQFLSENKNLSREQINAIHGYILEAYTVKKDLPHAGRYYSQLIHSIPEDATNHHELLAFLTMIRYKLAIKQYDEARRLIRRAESLYRKHNLQDGLKWMYLYQYQADSSEGKMHAALASYKKYKDISDSIFTNSREKQVASLERQYESEIGLRDQLKEQNLQLLRTEGKLQSIHLTQANTRTNVLLGGLLLMSGLLAAGYRVYIQKQKSNRLLEKQKIAIDQQNISLKRLVDQQVKLIKEKEWLIKEVHHRVKNNLQIIASLLSFQSKSLKDASAQAAIRNSQNRVHAMSFIHQRLYNADNMQFINIENYIHELVQYLKEALNSEQKFSIELEVIPADLSVSQIVPIGLILNEVITNSVKYAFRHQTDPKIMIRFDNDGADHYLLSIADNGSGLPTVDDWQNYHSLGFTLIQTMAEQLDAEFELFNDHGLVLTFKFRQESI